MVSKFFLSTAIALFAVAAAFIDGERDVFVLADQSWSLFFSGLAAMLMSMVVINSTKSSDLTLEVAPGHLLWSIFGLFALAFLIIVIGQVKDPLQPSMILAGFRTALGMTALSIGLLIADRISIRGQSVG